MKRLPLIAAVFLLATSVCLAVLYAREMGAAKRADELARDRDRIAAQLLETTTELDAMKDSDRLVWEKLTAWGTDDFAEALESYREFSRMFPLSPYKDEAEKEIRRIGAMIKDQEKEERDAIARANKAPDADSALSILEEYRDSSPTTGPAFQEKLKAYQEAAAPVRTAREAERTLGLKLDEIDTDWIERSGLAVPCIKARITNTGDAPVAYLKLVARFFEHGKKDMFGSEVSNYIVSALDTFPFEPGESRMVKLTGTAGYNWDWSLAVRQTFDAQIHAVTTVGGKPALIRSIEIQSPGSPSRH